MLLSRPYSSIPLTARLQREAIRVIDETLHKRGKMNLIDGQPLHLLEVTLPLAMSPSKQKAHLGPLSSTTFGSTFPMDDVPAPRVSTSKRSSPALADEPSSKRKKVQQVPSTCAVCDRPHHLIKDCPTVAEGPKRYFVVIFDSDALINILFLSPVSPGRS